MMMHHRFVKWCILCTVCYPVPLQPDKLFDFVQLRSQSSISTSSLGQMPVFASGVDNFKPGSHFILPLPTHIDSCLFAMHFIALMQAAPLKFLLVLFGPENNPLTFVLSQDFSTSLTRPGYS